MRFCLGFSILIFSGFFSLASAQVGSTVDALGGAGLAGTSPLDSASINPATLTELNAYFAGAYYFHDNLDANTTLNQYTAFLTDSTSNGFAKGALLYRMRDYDQGGAKVHEDVWQASLAAAVNKRFSLGLSGYRIKTDLPVGSDYTQHNADLSLLWIMTQRLALGAATRGVFGSKDNAVFLPSRVTPSGGLGLQYYLSDMIIFKGDLNYKYEGNPNQRFSHHLGSEFLIRGEWRLRLGLAIDDYKAENHYTMGLGWFGPRLKINYAFQKEYRQEYGDSHSIDIYLDL